MRYLFTAILFATITVAEAQTKADSIQQIRNTVKWYDLDFTDAEADSMLGNVTGYYQLYKGMHKNLPANDIPFPFAFNPAPAGMKVSSKKEKITWDIPLRTIVPANKNDLAFYSIPQLAALILTKKISSVDLTKFFIDRLKKWAGTVFTHSEEILAEQTHDQANRHDDHEKHQGQDNACINPAEHMSKRHPYLI